MVAYFVPIALLGTRNAPVLTVLGHGSEAGSTGTYPGQSFGTAATDRYIIACVGYSNAGGYVDGVTIGGIAGTRLVQTISPFGSVRTEIYIANVPTGTSGTVQIGSTGAGGDNCLQLYGVTGLVSSSAFATSTASGNSPLAFSANVSSLGFAIGFAYSHGTPGATATWTGLTTTDVNLRFAVNAAQYSAAHLESSVAVTPLAPTVTLVTTNAFSGVVATFQ